MKNHLHYYMTDAVLGHSESRHAQTVMKDLGITYQHAICSSVMDCWTFWNCEDVPYELPAFIRIAEIKPKDFIGHGLSEETATLIESEEMSCTKCDKKLDILAIKQTGLCTSCAHSN